MGLSDGCDSGGASGAPASALAIASDRSPCNSPDHLFSLCMSAARRMLRIESMTERKRITCPETGLLEQVELDSTPLGHLVTCCGRNPDRELACGRECARRMDHRDRADLDDRERVLVSLASLRDDAASIASALASHLADDCLAVELAELGTRSTPPLEDYDAVVIGAQVRFGRHARATIDYIREHLQALAAIPAFFYSVGGHGGFNRDGCIPRTTRGN